jgi:O-antigen/teichoic acid export membrane protein
LKKAAIQIFAVGIAAKVFIGIATIVAIRCMPESQYGEYTFALALGYVAMQTLSAAYNSIYIVGFSKLGIAGSKASFLLLQIFSVVALTILTLPFVAPRSPLYWWTIIFIVTGVLSEYSKSYFQQRLEFALYSVVEFARSLLFLLLVCALYLRLHNDLLAWHMVAVQAVGMLSIFVLFGFRHSDLSLSIDLNGIAGLAKAIWHSAYRYLFVYFVLLAALSQMDIMMLRTFSAPSELATYGAAFRYYTLIQLALSSINVILLPAMQRITKIEELAEIIGKHRGLVIAFAATTLVGAWVARWIIPFLNAQRYPGCVGVFRVLTVSAVFSFAFSPYVNLLMRCRDFKFLSSLVIFALAVDITANWLLIPHLGAIGASFATLSAFFIVNGGTYLRSQRYVRNLGKLEDGLALQGPC